MIKQSRILADVEALRAYTATPGSGVTRLSFSPEEAKARAYLTARMQEAGLAVYAHPAGCIIGRLAGKNPHAPAVMSGSHYDTVLHGGAYDGVCGVVSALEVARSMQEDGFVPEHPYEVVAFVEEEGMRFGHGLLSSAALLGMLDAAEFGALCDKDGARLTDCMRAADLNPDAIHAEALGKDALKAFVEVHIEQGPVLEAAQKQIGIVSGIASMNFGTVTVRGRADHAGTTPMGLRQDAMQGAMRFLSRFYEIAQEIGNGAVATVGQMEVSPGSANVVPAQVRFSIDYRCCENGGTEQFRKAVQQEADALCAAGWPCAVSMRSAAPAIDMDPRLVARLTDAAAQCGCSCQPILSGAGHDAMNMARFYPTGMLFIPSVNGRSHCPEEFSAPEDLERGARVLDTAMRSLCSSTAL